MSRGTGSLRLGAWTVLASVLVVAATYPGAEGMGRGAELPSEVAGSVGGCDTGPRMVGRPRGPASGPHRLAFGSMGAISSPSDLVTDGGGPEYYRFPMVSTKRVPGTGNATGVGEVAFAQSPFGVALAGDGSYDYGFTVRFERLRPPRSGTFVVWATTPELDQVVLAGELTDPVSFSGKVAWNKFLVVVTLEPVFDPDATMWTGPIVIRGMSRSGMMHTMAGHGPFEEENCAAYGYE